MKKFKSYVGKRVRTPSGKEIVFGQEPYETSDSEEIEALKKALEVVEVGGDGTDGSGRKVKVAGLQTLEPETSPEADSLVVSENTSVAERVAEEIHEEDKGSGRRK